MYRGIRTRSHSNVPQEAWIFLILLVLLLGFFWFRASMEAQVYNRITGANVTTWEALWVELRIQAEP